MGKAGKLRKKRRLEQGLMPAKDGVFGALLDMDKGQHLGVSAVGTEDANLVTEDEMEITLQTLSRLANNPSMLQAKTFKPLRVLIHKFQNDVLIPAGKSLSGKVSDNLQSRQHEQAIRNLALMRQRGEVPRLGALQRWVRDCDAVGFTDKLVVRTLDAILRTADPLQVPTNREGKMEDGTPLMPHEGKICRMKAWEPLKGKVEPCKPYPIISREDAEKKFDLIGNEKGADRLPPNMYDCKIYGSKPGAVVMDPNPPPVERIPAPFLNGSCMLRNVLTHDECGQILGLAMGMGLQPDKPLGQKSDSVLADNMVWCADKELMDIIFKRCEPFMPPYMDKRKLAGVNRRWRLYRYLPGAEYRPHIDGAWPESGVEDGKYVYDVNGDCWSRITFLVYLNDDFEGGWTTFFTPSPTEGSLEAYPVKPTAGCVMLFPHGDAEGSILHEGSGVSSGAKFIIRTDVLYYKQKSE
eukprot:Nk52_evm30s2011 gene=Nk52_evmTU30s2011